MPIIICEKCGVEVQARTTRVRFCPEHKEEHDKEYMKKYNKKYKSSGMHQREGRRKYTKRGLGKIKDANIYTEYCKNNCDTVDGCLNCICPECIQPVNSDSFLRWEKEEQFFENDYV